MAVPGKAIAIPDPTKLGDSGRQAPRLAPLLSTEFHTDNLSETGENMRATRVADVTEGTGHDSFSYD